MGSVHVTVRGGADVKTGTDGGLQGGGQFQVVVAVLAGGGL